MFTLQRLISKKMNRKQFLIALGVITFAITGVSGIFKTLKDPNLLGVKGKKAQGGFGTGPYGI